MKSVSRIQKIIPINIYITRSTSDSRHLRETTIDNHFFVVRLITSWWLNRSGARLSRIPSDLSKLTLFPSNLAPKRDCASEKGQALPRLTELCRVGCLSNATEVAQQAAPSNEQAVASSRERTVYIHTCGGTRQGDRQMHEVENATVLISATHIEQRPPPRQDGEAG